MSLRRVVITGLGIVSSIGNNQQEVTEALKAGKSGLSFSQEYAGLQNEISIVKKQAIQNKYISLLSFIFLLPLLCDYFRLFQESKFDFLLHLPCRQLD